MHKVGAGNHMTIAEQALFLLDTPSSILHRKKIENFHGLDGMVDASLPGAVQLELEQPEPNLENSFSVASRMGRTNYEEHAKVEALLHALGKMRAINGKKGPHAGRVLRGT